NKSSQPSSESSAGQSQQVSTGQAAQQSLSYQAIQPVSVSVIDFKELAKADEQAARSRPAKEPPVFIMFPEPIRIPEPQGVTLPPAPFVPAKPSARPLIPSPQPALSFLA